jgi:hypothetical protein
MSREQPQKPKFGVAWPPERASAGSQVQREGILNPIHKAQRTPIAPQGRLSSIEIS